MAYLCTSLPRGCPKTSDTDDNPCDQKSAGLRATLFTQPRGSVIVFARLVLGLLGVLAFPFSRIDRFSTPRGTGIKFYYLWLHSTFVHGERGFANDRAESSKPTPIHRRKIATYHSTPSQASRTYTATEGRLSSSAFPLPPTCLVGRIPFKSTRLAADGSPKIAWLACLRGDHPYFLFTLAFPLRWPALPSRKTPR